MFDELNVSDEKLFWTLVKWIPRAKNEKSNLSAVVDEIEKSTLSMTVNIFKWIPNDTGNNIENIYKLNKHDFYFKMLQKAIKSNYIKTTYMLMTKGMVDPSDDDNWAIRYCSFHNFIEIAKVLLRDKRVDPSATENWSIKWAAIKNHIEITTLLLRDKRVNPCLNNNLIIKTILKYGHVQIAKMLLNHPKVISTFLEDDARSVRDTIEHHKEIFDLLQDYINKKHNDDGNVNELEKKFKRLKNKIF
jgi:hypothetical protein